MMYEERVRQVNDILNQKSHLGGLKKRSGEADRMIDEEKQQPQGEKNS